MSQLKCFYAIEMLVHSNGLRFVSSGLGSQMTRKNHTFFSIQIRLFPGLQATFSPSKRQLEQNCLFQSSEIYFVLQKMNCNWAKVPKSPSNVDNSRFSNPSLSKNATQFSFNV